uniref:Sulfatase n=1 Tax=Caulobacter sp. (strain K31) TaxID=366602 RepID=B0T3D9_CAUSK
MTQASRPNILLITCDQYRFPRFSYGADAGFSEPLKRILGFQREDDAQNPYAPYFPGLLALRQNAALLRNHTIAASACTPSRAVIYTGQYGTKTGVTQTDGLFKSGDSYNFPWLAADGIPTLGTWMREAGYSTHYFGKWHVSNPPEHSLDRYGFDDWEESYPEPHGAAINNLGVYRDAGFTDQACAFIRRKALALNYNRAQAVEQARDPYAAGPDADNIPPWFAVASFTNPHDIATYPAVIAQALPTPDNSGTQSIFGPLTVPLQGQKTPPPTAGTIQIALNALGFPQDCAKPSPTQNESLADKPSCQRDYAYKVGLALNAKTGFNIVNTVGSKLHDQFPNLSETPDLARRAAVQQALKGTIPFQLSDDPDGYALQFLQLYGWLHAVVDTHVTAVLKTLEETGQADNTIVIFLADHGEYAAAHGMMIEKWHTAYQEALHVPVVVRFPPSTKVVENEPGTGEGPLGFTPRQIDALTSHIDILPTVLGLAGVTPDQRTTIAERLGRHRPTPPLPGVDLSGLLKGEIHAVIEPDGRERQGVLFITDDEITAPSASNDDPANLKCDKEFEVYRQVVETVNDQHRLLNLAPGSVRQPNHVRCVRTLRHKLSRYFDPSGEAAEEWEMYDLERDPNEAVNLVRVASPLTARTDLPSPFVTAEVQAEADQLAKLLAELEARDL